MKCHSTLDSPLYKESPMYPGIWREGEKRSGGGGALREQKREKQDSPITVSNYELYMSCSFNTVCSLPRFVTIKYSHQHLCSLC